MKPKQVVFLHGMYLTALCWEQWIPYFRSKGYTCFAPNWPGRDRTVHALRSGNPDPELGKLGLTDVVEHYARIIQGMDEKPVLIGHSMGGLVAQLLMQRNLAAAGVSIHSAPPAGVFVLRWSFIRSNWPAINPLASSSEPHRMTLSEFQYAFVNGLPAEEQRVDYERYVVPESRRVPRQAATRAGWIDFRKPHAPLLMISGTADHIIPAALCQANFERYRASPSPADLREFPGRVHFTIGQKKWEMVADSIIEWLESL